MIADLPNEEWRAIKGYNGKYFISNKGRVYKSNGYDIALVQRLLQHSSAATTQRYIGIEPQRIEQAIENHARLM